MLTKLQVKVGLFFLFRIAKWTGFDIQPCHKSWKAIADAMEYEARLTAVPLRQA